MSYPYTEGIGDGRVICVFDFGKKKFNCNMRVVWHQCIIIQLWEYITKIFASCSQKKKINK